MMAIKNYVLAALSAASTLAAVVQPTPRASSFVTISGSHFDIDGEVGYFAGTNCYWCPFTYNTAEVDTTLSDIASSGLKVVRVLGFSDWNTLPPTGEIWFQLLNATGSIINTGADGLQNLDYVVASAEQHGLKLIIPLVNNWDDFGGINAYVNAFGGNATSWFTNAAAQSQYRTYIQAVVSRYINSTAIFAWELANEPRCAGCDTSVIADWATGVSQYIKSLDPNHLVTLGDEGLGLSTGDGSYPYTYASGTDFALNIQIKSLDFGTFHLYPDGWGETYPWGSSWVQTHAQACVEAGKVCIMEEYGAVVDRCTNMIPWQNTSMTSPGMGGDLFWQWGETFVSGYGDSYSINYGSSDWQCVVQDHVAAISGKSPPPSTTTTTTPTGPTASSSCSTLWGQCGGNGYPGTTCCAQGTCTYLNDWYSQCQP
ncbi:hypothetical protein TGAMA5MH_08875 [Trichoderma gamsii]|uniref:Mannan endo-1,4-beta-mannosidase A n=1 Tax=Trichoderma gamsii TaxID=398673 RepID=A0A2K0T0Z5_9HYPO|nr:hypothetical protein TGAMA5MH_08875 [Trichoderma gamsii]